MYSGGDDAALVFGDQGVQWKERKTHGAGVTEIVVGGGRMVTGSYDEVLRVWDERTRKVVDDVKVGGGVWRVEPWGKGWVIAAMQAGPKVVHEGLEGGKGTLGLGIVKEWGDMNLCYGVTVHKDVPKQVSWCSFYDQILSVEGVDL